MTRVEIAEDLLSTAAKMDNDLTERGPMMSQQLIAGHANMHSTLMAAQIHATLELAEQARRIADALERAQECVSAQNNRWRWRAA
jgi:hypothetical protein